MRVLVTGAGGFLGPRIVESLLLEGCTSLRLQFRQPPREESLQVWRTRFPHATIEPMLVNLLARDGLSATVADIDCIVHAAAGTKGAAADMFLNSVVATRNLLDAAVHAGVRRFLLVSSFAVYDTEYLPTRSTLTEQSPTEPTGTPKGSYGFAKTQQDLLVRRYQQEGAVATILVRPGVIYGPGGGAFSARVGIAALGRFIRLGSSGKLPLTFVDNCADGIAIAALRAPPGSIYNSVDDDLPTCGEFLTQYRAHVRTLKVLPVPYPLFMLGSRWLAAYNKRSKGQLPELFTPAVVRSMYRPLNYSNAALKSLGWSQRVSTSEGLRRHFSALKSALEAEG